MSFKLGKNGVKGVIISSEKSSLKKCISSFPGVKLDGFDNFVYVKKNVDAQLAVDSGSYIIVVDSFSNLALSDINSKNIGVFLLESSRLNLVSFNDSESDTKITCHLKKGSLASVIFGLFGGKKNKLVIDNRLDGEGSKAYVKGVFFSNNSQDFEITTDSYHNTKNTKSDIVVKGALLGTSKVMYKGKIKIQKTAQMTDSFLQNHNMLLSSGSVCVSVPSLEIDANDVKAGHGATIGKPDEEDMFYIMARGISRKVAERLLISGFFSSIIENIDMPIMKKRFEEAVYEKVNP